MDKREKYIFQKSGITLIALVITIIVLLILAGVSINLIVGQDGILTNAQYATFMNEMTEIEEAINIWKTGEMIGTDIEEAQRKIPTDGLYSESDLSKTTRLTGEVGYYRVWSLSDSKPDIDIHSSDSLFNETFASELVYYPAGVQDLYYIDNEALGINKKKKYLIDASNGMVYSTNGIVLNGVQCYSLNMAKMAMSGYSEMPVFAEAEVSGSGGNLAGNISNKYKVDENGNYVLDENGNKIENPDYNPYGFEIIASNNSDNIYKLYNNGDLYAKGVKGIQLQSNSGQTVDTSKWSTFEVPSIIGGYKKIIQGSDTMFIIDNNDELWAWGNNDDNKLGLTQTQLLEYTEREPVKLNVNSKKVYNVFSNSIKTFVVTTDNELYAMGSNSGYLLGLGYDNTISTWQKVESITNPKAITSMWFSRETQYTIIKKEENGVASYYATGKFAKVVLGNGGRGTYKKFVQIWNGYTYKEDSNGNYIIDTSIPYDGNIDIDQDIKEFVSVDACAAIVLLNDNKIYSMGRCNGWSTTEDGLVENVKSVYPDDIGANVKHIYSNGYGFIVEKINGDIYAANGVRTSVGFETTNRSLKKVELPTELMNSGIKQIYSISKSDADSAVYYLANNGDLYASSNTTKYFGGDIIPSGVQKVNIPKISSLYNFSDKIKHITNETVVDTNGTELFLGEDGKLYTIGNDAIRYGNSILQLSWKIVANNVEKVALGVNNTIAYVSKGNVYIAGSDLRILDQGNTTETKIEAFRKLDDPLINDIVKDVSFPHGQMVILTSTGTLYSTGLYSLDGSFGWPNDRIPGWPEKENKTSLIKLLDNVTYFSGDEYEKLAISNGKLYSWGMFNVSRNGIREVKEIDVSKVIDVTKIKYMLAAMNGSFIIDTDGKLYGRYQTSQYVGTDEWKDISSQLNGEKAKTIVNTSRGYTQIVLTEEGHVYGRGYRKYLGLGDSSSAFETNFVKLPIENVAQITGSGNYDATYSSNLAFYFIAIKNDGTVYGTGSNKYGILGRWIGIDRKTPNSRYKTAFEWVECPELEI